MEPAVVNFHEVTVHAKVTAVGELIVLAEDAVGIPRIGIVDHRRRQVFVYCSDGIEALPILPPQDVADIAVQRRRAMLDLLTPDLECGVWHTYVTQIGLVDLGALGVHDRGLVEYPVRAAVVVSIVVGHAHVLELEVGPEVIEEPSAVPERGAECIGVAASTGPLSVAGVPGITRG